MKYFAESYNSSDKVWYAFQVLYQCLCLHPCFRPKVKWPKNFQHLMQHFELWTYFKAV